VKTLKTGKAERLCGFEPHPLRQLIGTWISLSAAVLSLAATNAAAQGGSSPGGVSFAWRLYDRLSSQSTQNLLFSPYSVSSALAMTYAGARGETAEQMAQTLNLDPDPNEVAHSFGSIAHLITTDARKADAEFRVANSLWGQRGYHFLAPYLNLLDETFLAPLQQVDFAEPEVTRLAINSWIADATKGNLADLLEPGSIDTMDRLVLVNAVYFRSAWESRFATSLTRDAPFSLLSGDSISVPTMHQEHELAYFENESVQMVEVPYRGEFSLIVILPKSMQMPVTIESLDVSVRNWSELTEDREVNLFLPRFTLRNTYGLNDPLAAMGIHDLFTTRADLSGMTNIEPLMITEVAHAAWLQLDEAGTEAAAATAVIASGWGAVESMPRKPPVVFRADHPFLFLIRHVPTQTIVFLGRVMNPASGN
jgi:serpin B